MSRITKQIAEDTAKAMTAEKVKEAELLKARFKAAVTRVALKRVPEAIQALYRENEFKPYLISRNYFSLHGHGFSYRGVYADQDIPWHGGSNVLELSQEEGTALWNFEKEYKTADLKVQELREEIEVTLYHTLRTYKKVQDHFPEAFVHLPKLSGVTALSINLDALRQKISK